MSSLNELILKRERDVREAFDQFRKGEDDVDEFDVEVLSEILTDQLGLSLAIPSISKARAALTSPQRPQRVTLERFRAMFLDPTNPIQRALTGNLAIPDFVAFCTELVRSYHAIKSLRAGRVVSYIPALASVDPDLFAVSVCTVDGQQFHYGKWKTEFCLEGCVCAFTYLCALEQLGLEKVHERVGREPSGSPYDACKLNKHNKPHNPMINAGAISVCGMLHRHSDPADRFDKTMDALTQMAGDKPNCKIGFNAPVYLSEKETGDQNFASASMLAHAGVLGTEGDKFEDALDLYFQLCSVTVDCRSLANMAAMLAAGGVSPISGKRVVRTEHVRACLSCMYSCGMFDFAGEWGFTVGLPAKSGVSGALFVVVPNVFGMAIYSPLLNEHGSSVKGIELVKALASRYRLSIFEQLMPSDDDEKHRLPARPDPAPSSHTRSSSPHARLARVQDNAIVVPQPQRLRLRSPAPQQSQPPVSASASAPSSSSSSTLGSTSPTSTSSVSIGSHTPSSPPFGLLDSKDGSEGSFRVSGLLDLYRGAEDGQDNAFASSDAPAAPGRRGGRAADEAVAILKKTPESRTEAEVEQLCGWLTRQHIKFLDEQSVGVVRDLCRTIKYELVLPDTALFNQGDTANRMYIILSGSVSLWVQNEAGEYGDLPSSIPQAIQRMYKMDQQSFIYEPSLEKMEAEHLVSRKSPSAPGSSGSPPARRFGPGARKTPSPNTTHESSPSQPPRSPQRMVVKTVTALHQSNDDDDEEDDEVEEEDAGDETKIVVAEDGEHSGAVNGASSSDEDAKKNGLAVNTKLAKAHGRTSPRSRVTTNPASPKVTRPIQSIDMKLDSRTPLKFLGILRPGGPKTSFGELGLIADNVRSATVRTNWQESEFLVIEKSDFDTILKAHHKEMLEAKVRSMQTFELFSGMSVTHLNKISLYMEQRSFSAAQVIVKEGSPGAYFYFILKGRVDVTKRIKQSPTAASGGGTSGGGTRGDEEEEEKQHLRRGSMKLKLADNRAEEVVCGTLLPGQMFGHTEALPTPPLKHAYGYRCATACQLYVIHRDDLLTRVRVDAVQRLAGAASASSNATQ